MRERGKGEEEGRRRQLDFKQKKSSRHTVYKTVRCVLPSLSLRDSLFLSPLPPFSSFPPFFFFF